MPPRASALPRFFESGCLFFLPFCLLYLVFWRGHFPVWPLHFLFPAMSAGLLLLAGPRLAKVIRGLTPEEKWFWLGLAALCFLPGAYLEFPADPWEHFYRILSWQNVTYLSENPYASKFSYFFVFTHLKWFSIPQQVGALNLVSGMWLFLVAYQFYRLIGALGVTGRWAMGQTVVFLLSFGTNIFGWRYYALSSTPLAHLAFFALVAELLPEKRWWNDGIKHWAIRAGLLLLIALNHRPELLYAALGVAYFNLYWLIGRLPLRAQRRLAYTTGAFFLVGFVAGPLIYSRYPAWVTLQDEIALNRLGFFDLLRPHSPFRETWGTLGLLSLLAGLWLLRRKDRLGGWAWVPILPLVYSPLAIVVLRFCTQSYDAYRLLYAAPISVALLRAMQIYSASLPEPKSRKVVAYSMVGLALLLGIARYPVRGRLPFHFYVPPPERSLAETIPLADWIARNRPDLRHCLLISDDPTWFALSTYFGREFPGKRLNPPAYFRNVKTVRGFMALMRLPHFCGFLFRYPDSTRPFPESWAARLSGHFLADQVDPSQIIASAALSESHSVFGEFRWRVTALPAGYRLFEPPLQGCWVYRDQEKEGIHCPESR